jgi:hypothetical protein
MLQLSSDEAVLASEALLVNKLNLLLVQILKQDWPDRWPTFITDLVAASKCVPCCPLYLCTIIANVGFGFLQDVRIFV